MFEGQTYHFSSNKFPIIDAVFRILDLLGCKLIRFRRLELIKAKHFFSVPIYTSAKDKRRKKLNFFSSICDGDEARHYSNDKWCWLKLISNPQKLFSTEKTDHTSWTTWHFCSKVSVCGRDEKKVQFTKSNCQIWFWNNNKQMTEIKFIEYKFDTDCTFKKINAPFGKRYLNSLENIVEVAKDTKHQWKIRTYLSWCVCGRVDWNLLHLERPV